MRSHPKANKNRTQLDEHDKESTTSNQEALVLHLIPQSCRTDWTEASSRQNVSQHLGCIMKKNIYEYQEGPSSSWVPPFHIITRNQKEYAGGRGLLTWIPCRLGRDGAAVPRHGPARPMDPPDLAWAAFGDEGAGGGANHGEDVREGRRQGVLWGQRWTRCPGAWRLRERKIERAEAE
jgi:hypothetical protein